MALETAAALGGFPASELGPPARTGRWLVRVLIALGVALLVGAGSAAIFWFGLTLALRAFPPDGGKSIQAVLLYVPLVSGLLGLVNTILKFAFDLWKMWIESRPDEEANTDLPSDQPAPVLSAVPTIATSSAAAEYYRLRKDQYKEAWRKRGARLNNLSRRYEIVRIWRYVAFAAIGYSIASFAATLTASGIVLRLRPDGFVPSAEALPLWADKSYYAALCVLTALASTFVGWRFVRGRCERKRLLPIATICVGGALLTGGSFLMQLSPETLSFLNLGPLHAEILPDVPVPYLVYVMLQKLVVVPVIGFLFCALGGMASWRNK